jgi:hypothetical protein
MGDGTATRITEAADTGVTGGITPPPAAITGTRGRTTGLITGTPAGITAIVIGTIVVTMAGMTVGGTIAGTGTVTSRS